MNVEFNINHQVKVKLTEAGIAELKRQNDELNKVFPKANLPFSVNVDEEGYTSFQMRDLMSRLGVHMDFNHKIPFETNIIITNCEKVEKV